MRDSKLQNYSTIMGLTISIYNQNAFG